jgi:hypothetical protein
MPPPSPQRCCSLPNDVALLSSLNPIPYGCGWGRERSKRIRVMQMGSMEFVASALEELLPELSLEEQPQLQNQSRERDCIRKRHNKHSPPPRPSLISVRYVMEMGSMGMDFVAPALEELLPDLSREEQLRLQNKARRHDRILKPHNKHAPRPRPSPFSEWYVRSASSSSSLNLNSSVQFLSAKISIWVRNKKEI